MAMFPIKIATVWKKSENKIRLNSLLTVYLNKFIFSSVIHLIGGHVMTDNTKELQEFRAEVSAWMKENKPADPGFLLPQTFMEVGTEEQLEFLIKWQRKVYDAGYIGLSWPKEYGGARTDPGVSEDCRRGDGAATGFPSCSTPSAFAGQGP